MKVIADFSDLTKLGFIKSSVYYEKIIDKEFWYTQESQKIYKITKLLVDKSSKKVQALVGLSSDTEITRVCGGNYYFLNVDALYKEIKFLLDNYLLYPSEDLLGVGYTCENGVYYKIIDKEYWGERDFSANFLRIDKVTEIQIDYRGSHLVVGLSSDNPASTHLECSYQISFNLYHFIHSLVVSDIIQDTPIILTESEILILKELADSIKSGNFPIKIIGGDTK